MRLEGEMKRGFIHKRYVSTQSTTRTAMVEGRGKGRKGNSVVVNCAVHIAKAKSQGPHKRSLRT